MGKPSERPIVLVSSDAHAGADVLGYRDYLERSFHEEFDAWARERTEDAWAEFDTEMLDTDDANMRLGVASFGSPYNWDSAKRLTHMDGEGIAAEVIFPNTVPPFYPRGVISAPPPRNAEEYRLRWAGVKAHNRWLADFCQEAPGRRVGLAQVFLNEIDDAIDEVHRARERGLSGVLVPSDHTLQLVNLYERRLDPFWAACCDVAMPVNRHSVFVGPPETVELGPSTDGVSNYEDMLFFKRGLVHVTLGGVFARFPDLKFVFTETPTTWVPDELRSLDHACKAALVRGTARYPLLHRTVEQLDLLPSEYFRRNIWLGASLMSRVDVERRHAVGVDRIMWGSDYPHHEGSWPETRLALRLNFWDVPDEELRPILAGNAISVYDLDIDFLQRVADRIGPSPTEIASPVSQDELPRYSMCPAIARSIDSLNAAIEAARPLANR